MTLEGAAESFGWGELVNFARHLPDGSATFRARHADAWRFSTGLQRSALLADAVDALNMQLYALNRALGGNASKPKPYPRPWDAAGAERIGSGAIPIADFNEWYYGGDD